MRRIIRLVSTEHREESLSDDRESQIPLAKSSLQARYASFPVALAEPKQTYEGPLRLIVVLLLISLAIMLYAVSVSFVWDEGFHLLAAQLMNHGKMVYLDFCFPQTPLNAFWNAAWLGWTNGGWRVTHVIATAACISAMALITQFAYSRFSGLRWQLSAAFIAALGTGLNSTLWKFGTCAQAYGLGTFLSVAAFRMALVAAGAFALWPVFVTGALTGGAAASTLLTAPLTPAILIWLLWQSQPGSRLAKFLGFAAGYCVPFIPIVVLFAKAPQQTWFNIVQYQAIFRRMNWLSGADAHTTLNSHDFDVLSAWLNDSTTFWMGALALVGVFAIHRFPSWSKDLRAEFYLAGWIALGFVVFIASARPTFQRYFVFAVPFVAALAAVGAVSLFSRLGFSSRPKWPTLALIGLLALALGKDIFDDRDAATWATYRKITEKIQQVTPEGGLIYADEQVYFLLNLTPPSGMEFSYSHKLDLPPAQEQDYHIVSEKELNAQVRAGRFATVETCRDERIDDMHLQELFTDQDDVGDCSIFSGKIRLPSKKSAQNGPGAKRPAPRA